MSAELSFEKQSCVGKIKTDDLFDLNVPDSAPRQPLEDGQ